MLETEESNKGNACQMRNAKTMLTSTSGSRFEWVLLPQYLSADGDFAIKEKWKNISGTME
jgi:hypothetical protein